MRRSDSQSRAKRWRRRAARMARRSVSRPGLGKNLLRFLLKCTHRADVRDRTVADARDTELRKAIIRWHAVYDHDVDGQRDALADSPDQSIVCQPGNEEAGR